MFGQITEDLMSIKKSYLNVTDNFGLIQPPEWHQNNRVKVSGNGARYTAEYLFALLHHNKLDNIEIQRLRKVFSSLNHPKHRGLLMRTPSNAFGQESIDNTVSALTASYILGSSFARDWLNYGKTELSTHFDTSVKRRKESRWLFRLVSLFGLRKIKYVYNNINPGYFNNSAYLGRFGQLIAHAKFCDGATPNLLLQFWWSLSILHSMWKNRKDHHADTYFLSYHLIHVAKNKTFITRLISRIWLKWFKGRRPYGLGQVLEENYGWKSHPSAHYLKNFPEIQ